MNIAEDVRNTIVVEMYSPCASAFIQTEIETFSIEQRENVMEKGVEVWELNTTAGGDHKQMRCECLILLHQPVMSRLGSRCRTRRRGGERSEPNDDTGRVSRLILRFALGAIWTCTEASTVSSIAGHCSANPAEKQKRRSHWN